MANAQVNFDQQIASEIPLCFKGNHRLQFLIGAHITVYTWKQGQRLNVFGVACLVPNFEQIKWFAVELTSV